MSTQTQTTQSSTQPSSRFDIETTYQNLIKRRVQLISALTLFTLLAFLIDLASGPSAMNLTTIIQGLLNPDSLSRGESVILYQVRLPYSVMAIVVGAALGLAGAEMQTALNNPLASPFTLGVSSAATLGAAFALVFDWSWAGISSTYIVPASAFVFALISTAIILLLANYFGAQIGTVVLFGISMFFALNAMVSFLQFLSSEDTLQQIVFWTMGSLARATWDNIVIVAVVFAVCLPLSMRNVWAMTLLRCGEDHARSSGVSVESLRLKLMIRVSLLTAVSIAFVGEIGFIGLVGPHIARLLIGEDHRFFLPASALCGALMMSMASIASKSLIPGIILPIGIVTSLVGIPLFMGLIITRARQS